jgi:hypothetical protein
MKRSGAAESESSFEFIKILVLDVYNAWQPMEVN